VLLSFTDRVATTSPPLDATLTIASEYLYQKTLLLFSIIPSVCPEPVLANDRFSPKQGSENARAVFFIRGALERSVAQAVAKAKQRLSFGRGTRCVRQLFAADKAEHLLCAAAQGGRGMCPRVGVVPAQERTFFHTVLTIDTYVRLAVPSLSWQKIVKSKANANAMNEVFRKFARVIDSAVRIGGGAVISDPPANNGIFEPFLYKNAIILPRQARDEHRESTQKKVVSATHFPTRHCDRLSHKQQQQK
jgi:hypothetical protein